MPGISEDHCELSVSGIGVRLNCDHAQLNRKLCERYQFFPAAGNVQLEGRVEWLSPTSLSSVSPPAIAFREGVVHFTTPGYEGSIDVEKRKASLSFSSSHPVEDVDYFLRAIYAMLLFHFGGVMIHGAGILRHGRAYLFFGHSGVGKTTVARLSQADQVLNDDLIGVMPDGVGWRAYATPFWNPTQVQPNPTSGPLAALLHLVQARRVTLKVMSPGRALAELMANMPVISANPALGASIMDRALNLLHDVPAYQLHFLPDRSFWQVVEVL
jgi:hypothetical protein